MKRWLVLLYGIATYTATLGLMLYLAGFIGGFLTPTRLDGEPTSSTGVALIIDLALVAAFGLQHSVMARPAFKRWLTRVVPEPAERTTYMLATLVVSAAMVGLWRPLPGVVWNVPAGGARTLIWFVYGLGW